MYVSDVLRGCSVKCYLPNFDNSMINLKFLPGEPIHNYEYFSLMYDFIELQVKLL